MVERSCFDIVGLFNERLKTTQDVEMWFRILSHYDIGHLAEKLTKERVHPNQCSKTILVHEKEKFITYLNIFEQIGMSALFTEHQMSTRPRDLARAYSWLADTMATNRKWHSFADMQYKKSIELYPSFSNPARLKLELNKVSQLLHFAFRKLKPVIYNLIKFLPKKAI